MFVRDIDVLAHFVDECFHRGEAFIEAGMKGAGTFKPVISDPVRAECDKTEVFSAFFPDRGKGGKGQLFQKDREIFPRGEGRFPGPHAIYGVFNGQSGNEAQYQGKFFPGQQ